MYAKTGVKTTVATFGTGALHWRADAAEKNQGPGSYFTAWLFGCVDQSWLHKLLKGCQIIFSWHH